MLFSQIIDCPDCSLLPPPGLKTVLLNCTECHEICRLWVLCCTGYYIFALDAIAPIVFPALCDTIREYFDDTYTEGYMSRNAILDYGINSLKQYSKDHGVDTSADMQALNREKIGADEINTDRITTSFKRFLLDIRKGIREKKPTSKNATVEALEIIQANIPNQPGKKSRLMI